MSSTHTTLLRVAGVLWIIWGAVHMLAAVMIVPVDAATAIGNIADAVPRETLQGTYPAALSGILSQHGWNLGWIGLTTLVCGALMWRGALSVVWLAALVGGLADVGYFVFLDLPGFVRFVPGTLMTVFSALAIALSGWVWFRARGVSS
ncbi:MAG: hypothetical protein AAF460_16020 [Pseudomonadota bacterium]